MTLEALDFESEHFFESHGHLQSAADMMRSEGAHDSQKHAQTQNLESLKSKIAEIFLPYFHPIQSARSLN